VSSRLVNRKWVFRWENFVHEAEKSRRRIRAVERIAELMSGILFKDGEPVKEQEQQRQQQFAA